MEQNPSEVSDPATVPQTLAQDPRQPRPSAFAFLAPAQAPDEIGRLGRFRVLKLLGEGGMGMVFLGDDPKLNRRVALKVMKPEAARHEEGRKRFLREARAAAAVKHDRVVAIYEVDEDGGVPFLVMPLLEGESLEDRLRRSPKLSAAEAAWLGREAAEGLAAAHAAGLVHRDVKPSNLWLEKTPDVATVKILDFGLARPEAGGEPLTETGSILGTAGYMAPEQARGAPVDARADLFSLGCVLYRICTGKAPFQGATLTDILLKLQMHYPPPPHVVDPGVSAAMSDLVMRMLAKEPAGRPASAREVAEALRAIERSLPMGTTPSDPSVSPDTLPPPVPPPIAAPRSLVAVSPPRPTRGWKRRLAVAIALTVLVLLALSPLLLPRVRSWLFSLAVQTVNQPPPSPVAYKGYIDVLIYDPENSRRQNVRLNEPDVLPLKPGDRFAVEAEMNPPAYLYILWIDADGTVDPVYPWKPGRWEERLAEEQPVGRLRRPEASDHFYPIKESAAGMETLVLLARETPLPRDADLRTLLGDVPPQTLKQGLRATVWCENGEVVKNEPGRAPAWDEEKIDDPVRATQEQIRSRLGGLFPYTRTVSFADRGK